MVSLAWSDLPTLDQTTILFLLLQVVVAAVSVLAAAILGARFGFSEPSGRRNDLTADERRRFGLIDLAVRFFGVSSLIVLAILADNVWAYVFAILFVATLITKLDFIQNIAAIVFDREWAIVKRQGSSREKRQKAAREVEEAEAREEGDGRPLEASEAEIQRTLQWEWQSTAALAECLNVSSSEIERSVVIADQSGERYSLVDAIIQMDGVDLVVESKAYVSEGTLSNATDQVLDALIAYLEFLRSRQRQRRVVAILLVPADKLRLFSAHSLGRELFVAAYNEEENTITNCEELHQWLER